MLDGFQQQTKIKHSSRVIHRMQILHLKMPAGYLLSAVRNSFGTLIQTINLPRGQMTFFRQIAQPVRLTTTKFNEFMIWPALGDQIRHQKPMPWGRQATTTTIIFVIPSGLLG